MSENRSEGETTGATPGGGPTVIDVTPEPGPGPEAEPKGPTETPSKHRGNLAAIVALATLVLAVATSPYWAPSVSSVLPWGAAPDAKEPAFNPAAIDAKLSALEARIGELAQAQQRSTALEQRVTTLEQRPAPGPNPQDAEQAAQQGQALRALGDRIAALEQRITTISAAASSQSAADASKALQAQIQTLGQKLDEQSRQLATLQSQKADNTDRSDAALVLTLSQLRGVITTARPYAAELQAAEALAKDAPDTLAELKKLDGRAQQGVPTVAMLAARYPAVANAAPPAGTPPTSSDEGWRARTWAKLKNLVTIRRVGEGQTQSSATKRGADVADAETALKTGDLAAAVAAVRRADGSASPALSAWLDDAQARLDAEAALAAAEATLLKRFLAEPSTGAKP